MVGWLVGWLVGWVASACNGMVSVFSSHLVDGLVEAGEFGRVFKHVELLVAADESAELYAYEPDAHSPGIKALEQFLACRDEHVVESGVGQALLKAVGVEICIAYFYTDTAGELLFFT